MNNKRTNTITKEDLYRNLDLVNSSITTIDNKISFLLAFVAIFLGLLFLSGIPDVFNYAPKIDLNNITNFPIKDIVNLNFGQIFPMLMVIILYILTICCFALLLIALKGKLSSKICKDYKLKTNDSIISFESISNMNLANYKKKYKTLNNYELINDINSQIYIKSIICNLKTKLYNYSIKLLIISFAIFFVCLIFNIL